MFRFNSALPSRITEINDEDTRYYIMARMALAEQLSFITAPDPAVLIKLAEVISGNQETLLRAIRDGKPGIDLPPVYGAILPPLIPDKDRADSLLQIIETKGELTPADCWPELKLISCEEGSGTEVDLTMIQQHYQAPVRSMGIVEAEAGISIPYAANTPSGILAIHANYYEFIPEEDIEGLYPTVLGAHQLESGKRYHIIITTTSGLYRYNTGSVVEVTGFYHKTPVIRLIRNHTTDAAKTQLTKSF